MKADPTRRRLYATVAVLSTAALLLLALLEQPGTGLRPSRSAPPFEVEEAEPLPAPAPHPANPKGVNQRL
jgi:hypothetical protein